MAQVNVTEQKDDKISKKLVNEVDTCVSDSLHGFALTHANVKLLQGWNVIVRSDVERLNIEKKVVLITGGGSGHEPGYVGYVGQGMLTAAVCGDIFASPSSTSIVDTIQTCASTAGVLLIVKNYTGDRLNFGKAAEVAKSRGIDTEMVVVGEDCALTSKDKSAGRRGLCGAIFIHKMAGAMAENGLSLKKIASFLRKSTTEMGTISISLSACSKPGQPESFKINSDTAEFGLGIHGEAGVEEIKMTSAAELVKKMIDHVRTSGYLPPLEGKHVALIVNNLGGTTNLELSIVAKEVVVYLESLKVHVKRCYVGMFLTSLEMAGVSLTLMILNEERLKLLDAPTNAPAWPKSGSLNELDKISIPCQSSIVEWKQELYEKPNGIGITMYRCLKKSCTALIDNEEKLNELDTSSGDGDCGSTLARGAKGIFLKLSNKSIQLPVNHPRDLFLAIAKELESTMGGSSGALLSLLFTAFANGLTENANVKEFINAFKLGINAVKRYGGADEGDRTMLDALCPCLSMLEKSVALSIPIHEMLQDAAKAARSGSDLTINMHARAGRASYVADKHLTQPDPGAFAVALVFEAIAKAYPVIDKKR